ncbi:hypothetical protein C823_005988 [Eubacterium plexicaudatum ASF492]|uniref:Uncharacterized protein n=1 Tax=Eubacterium plexicaudatum ASF492 TaxID=1235802 RepID=N2AZ83_9FIRM|nr:hypothetical protein C823_005988 [Eubacterium plexicaudatum ASF492]
MKRKLAVAAVLLAVGLTAGCGTDAPDQKQNVQTEDDSQKNTSAETAEDDSQQNADAGNTESADGESEERTEVRREKYDDCDGSGHGYVEIYYSDGSMETEEY